MFTSNWLRTIWEGTFYAVYSKLDTKASSDLSAQVAGRTRVCQKTPDGDVSLTTPRACVQACVLLANRNHMF